jgi:hypothetical protein
MGMAAKRAQGIIGNRCHQCPPNCFSSFSWMPPKPPLLITST